MTETAAQNFGALKEDVRNWYASRFGSFFSRATNQGLGAFFTFALLLTVAFVLGRMVWFKNQSDSQYLEQLMRTEMQPMSDVTKAAVLSVLLQGLGSAEISRELYCGDRSEGDCAWIEAIKVATERKIESARASQAGQAALNSAPAIAEDEQCGGNDPESRAKTQLRLKRFGLSPAQCKADVYDETVRVVPEQVADALGGSDADGMRTRDLRVVQATRDAQSFDDAMGELAPKIRSSASDTGPRLVAAYFINVDSVFQYWSRDSRARPDDLPTFRHWAARPYFHDLLTKLPATRRTETRAYLDFVGKGVVYTRCDEIRPDTSTDITVGAVCVDFALSEAGVGKLAEALDDTPISTAIPILFSPRDGGEFIALDARDPPDALDSRMKTWLESLSSRWAVEPASRREISQFDGADSLTYFVSLGVRPDGRSSGIVLALDGVGPLGSSPWLLFLTIAALVVAIYAYRHGAGSSRKLARSDQLLGRLRSLQVGVMQTDGAEQITAGNDRAEELVGSSLTAFGLDGEEPIKYWSLFDEKSIVGFRNHVVALTNSLDDIVGSLKLRTVSEIMQERAAGISSTYFVKLKRARPRKREWLMVTGGPILREGKPTGLARWKVKRSNGVKEAGSFGVIEEVSESTCARLTAFLENAIQGGGE